MKLKIGELAKRTGISSKTIRYYEQAGVITKAERLANGYRVYSEGDAHALLFIKHARELGFSVEEATQLAALWKNKRRRSEQVKKLATDHLQRIEQKLSELNALKRTLQHLVDHCHGDERPDCPILENLADVEH